MKKIYLFLSFIAFSAIGNSQTIVSTSAQNKKVILEEFTGIHCVYCPSGHSIAQGLMASNPGNVFVVNVHQGGYATPSAGEPDFRTTFGDGLAGQSNLTGYPSGTVNRTVFTGLSMTAGGTAMGRGNWSNAANQILAQSSYVNVGVEASIDINTRVLTVHVEAYYTGNSPVATNKMNIALLQNNTFGPQTGGNAGNNYNHMHRLVHLVTGQWGATISSTTTGSFFNQTYTYVIPASYNSIAAALEEMEIVAYVAEGNQKIISGNGCMPTFTGLPQAADSSINSVESIPVQCKTSIAPKFSLQNKSQNNLTSLAINYSINGGANQTYNWTGNLGPLQKATVQLPSTAYALATSNSVTISLPSDANNADNSNVINFNRAPQAAIQLTLNINTDDWGDECSWNIKNSSGATVQSGTGYGNNGTYNVNLNLTDDCYTFNLIDAYGDGGGAVTLVDNNNVTIYSTNGAYGSGESKNFSTGNYLGIEETIKNIFNVYPNPTSGILNIESQETANLQIVDMFGKTVKEINTTLGVQQINTSELVEGIYLLIFSNEKNHQIQKLIIKK